MATDETAKRSNCNHESSRCHALTTASTLMKRILNRVKWFFKVMQGMSSDRPRAVRYTENIRKRQAWKHLFTRSSVPSYQDWNIAENENLQQLLAEMNSNDSQTKTARENMRRQWAGYGEPKWLRSDEHGNALNHKSTTRCRALSTMKLTKRRLTRSKGFSCCS